MIIGFVDANRSLTIREGGPVMSVCADTKPEGLPVDNFDFITVDIVPEPRQLGKSN